MNIFFLTDVARYMVYNINLKSLAEAKFWIPVVGEISRILDGWNGMEGERLIQTKIKHEKLLWWHKKLVPPHWQLSIADQKSLSIFAFLPNYFLSSHSSFQFLSSLLTSFYLFWLLSISFDFFLSHPFSPLYFVLISFILSPSFPPIHSIPFFSSHSFPPTHCFLFSLPVLSLPFIILSHSFPPIHSIPFISSHSFPPTYCFPFSLPVLSLPFIIFSHSFSIILSLISPSHSLSSFPFPNLFIYLCSEEYIYRQNSAEFREYSRNTRSWLRLKFNLYHFPLSRILPALVRHGCLLFNIKHTAMIPYRLLKPVDYRYTECFHKFATLMAVRTNWANGWTDPLLSPDGIH